MGGLNFKKQHGFSVVELMLVLTLLSVILALGYMFFSFGYRAFGQGERQTIAQQAIRSGTEFITSEIRYADEITINPDNISNNDDYYYIFQQGDSVVYQDKNKNLSERIILDSSADNIVYRVNFAENHEKSNISIFDIDLIINFTIETEDNLYSLETNVYILNLEDIDNYNDFSGNQGHITGIKYKKPF